jgi:hypothetical protein
MLLYIRAQYSITIQQIRTVESNQSISQSINQSIMTRKEGINPLFDYSSNNNNNNSGIETYRFDAARNLSLPSVTVPRRKEPTQRPCGRVAFGMKVLIVLIPIYFYRQIMDVSLSTDMFSSPVIRFDYSDVRSIHDLSSGKVEQWCQRNVYDCKCKDPMVGFPRESETSWQKAHGANVELAAASTTATTTATTTTATIRTTATNPDVVFFGDGLIDRWQHHKALFDSFFSMNSGGKFEGITMGISGDRVSQESISKEGSAACCSFVKSLITNTDECMISGLVPQLVVEDTKWRTPKNTTAICLLGCYRYSRSWIDILFSRTGDHWSLESGGRNIVPDTVFEGCYQCHFAKDVQQRGICGKRWFGKAKSMGRYQGHQLRTEIVCYLQKSSVVL